jgi:transposase-like protein
MTSWRQRLLEAVWPFVSLDGIVVHVRGEKGSLAKHTVDVALGANLPGKRSVGACG